MNYPLTIAVDFDGTICRYAFPDCGPPRTEVIEALRALRAEGWKIIIHTSRVNSDWPEPGRTQKCEAMVLYLISHEVPFDEIWGIAFEWVSTSEGTQGYMWGFKPHLTGKPVAHVYLDDRAMEPEPLYAHFHAMKRHLCRPDSSRRSVFAAEALARFARVIAKRANDEHKEY